MDNARKKTQELTMWGNTLSLLILLNFYHKASKTFKIAKLKKETKGSYLIRFLPPRLSVFLVADGRKTDTVF